MGEVQLKEYIERLLDAADKRYEQRFDAQEKAIELASARAQIVSIISIIIAILSVVVVYLHK